MIRRTTMLFALALTALVCSNAAIAQSDSGAQGAGKQQQAQQMMQQYRQKAAKLQQIHEATIKSNPQLASEQKQFETQVREAVQKHGYNVDKGQQRLQQMAEKLQGKNLSQADKQSTMKDFQAERQKMVTARNAALQQPDIQKSGKQLEQHTIDAMQKQNDNTKQLLDQMTKLRAQLQSAMPSPAQQGKSAPNAG